MFSKIAADVVVLLHVAFILFVVLGGLIVIRRPRLAWAHLPAVAWGALVELAGWFCPLTPLENLLRSASGDVAYGGGFIERYILPIVYPPGLTRGLQVTFGLAVLVVNLFVYGALLMKIRKRRDQEF